jgi:hypothetical protein
MRNETWRLALRSVTRNFLNNAAQLFDCGSIAQPD